MNKAITIILNETTFEIEDKAYEKLKEYLSQVEKYFSKEEAKDEIIKDIENNFASKLEEKISRRKQKIILEKDVDDLIKIIGRVEDFENENKSDKDSTFSEKEEYSYKKLYRNPDDIVLAGVCSGLASYLGIESNIIRILFIIFTIFTGFFPGFIIYFVLWAIVPLAETGSQKLEMDGEIINLKNIKEKIYKMKDDIKKATMNESNRSYVKQKVRNFKRELRDELRKESDKDLKDEDFFSRGKDRRDRNNRSNIFYILLKIFLIIIGISFIISAISGLIGITVATSFMLFSPNVIAHIINIQGIPYNYIQIISILGILSALIPLIFILVAGISFLRRKNVFKVGWSVFLLVAWIFIISGLVFFSIRYVSYNSYIPSININTTPWKDYEAINTNETNYILDNFNEVKIEGPYSIKITKGDKFLVKAKGEEFVLNEIKVNVDSNVLKISPKDVFNSVLNGAAFEIEVPELTKVTLNGATKLDILGFNSDKDLDLELNGASFCKLDSYFKNISINLSGLSRLEFEKSDLTKDSKIENITADINGASSADLLNIETKNADINLLGASSIKINASNNLKIKADGASSVEYLGNPIMNQRIKGLSSVKKIEKIKADNLDNSDSATLNY